MHVANATEAASPVRAFSVPLSCWLAGNGKRHRLVRSAVIRPEVFAVERERAAGKRHHREVRDLRHFLRRIEACDGPFLRSVWNVLVLSPTEYVEHSIDKSVPADFRADVDRARNVS